MQEGVDRETGTPPTATLVDLGWFASFVVAYVGLDLVTRALASYQEPEANGSFLAFGAVIANPLPTAFLAIVVGVAIARAPARFLGPWSVLEQGDTLRLLAAPLLLLLTWQGALLAYDFHLEQSNLADRLLLVALGIGALSRPGLLLAFVAQQRILATPLAFPFGAVPGQNIDELLVIVLVVLAGAHLIVAVTGRVDTSPVLALIVAAVATHFFVPGFGKVRDGWLSGEDLSYLAPNAYAAGWLGQTDGGVAEALSGIFASLGVAARLGTLALELGVAVAALHHRLFRWWLVPAVAFHVINFATLGYWFLGWVLLEVGLIVVLWRTPRAWLDRNLTPARGLATFGLVAIAGVVIFHPPRLRWFDSPVAEGYRIEVVGESGATYHVPFAALAPFEEDLAFTSLLLGQHGPVTGPYGAVGGVDRVEVLRELVEPAEVDGLRVPLTAEQRILRERSEDFLVDWIERANQRAGGDGPAIDALWSLRAPTWFWTGRAEPTYRFDERIVRLQVDRLTSLTTDDEILRWSTTVVVIDEDGVTRQPDAG